MNQIKILISLLYYETDKKEYMKLLKKLKRILNNENI
jgi:hypothetical protein